MQKGYLLIILSAIGYAALPIFIKQGYNIGLTIDAMLILRFFIASILLVFIMLASRKKRFTTYNFYLPNLVVQGLLFFGSAYCYTLSIKHMSATVTNILLYTYPLMVVIMSTVIFHEKISFVRVVTLFTTFLGCLLVIDVTNTSMQISKLGVLYGIGSAIFYAIYNINGQYLSEKLEPLTISAYTTVVCLLATIAVYPPMNVLEVYSFPAIWIVGLSTGIFCTVMPLLWYLKGLAFLGASRASILSTIEPVITTVLAWGILGERLTITQLSGGMLILVGVLMLQFDKLKPTYGLHRPVSAKSP